MAAPFASPLFLREPELRRGLELMLFAQGRLARSLEGPLAELGLGAAHQRALYFIARQPGLTVGDLIALLGITKQSLNRVLGDLAERGLVEQQPGRTDRRQRLLRLTEAGAAAERALFETLRARLASAYAEAGPDAVQGFWQVLERLAGPEAQAAMRRFGG